MALALLGLAFAWAVMLLFGAMEFDRGLLHFARATDDSAAAVAARWATELGGAWILLSATALAAIFLLFRRDWRGTILLIAISLSGRWMVTLQKDWAARLRPDPQGHIVPVESLSFPSGHAANAAIVWVLIALLLPLGARGRALAAWAAAWVALLVGLSRVMLGVHWPSDVIGGWAFGLFWTLLLLTLSDHFGSEGTPRLLLHSDREGGGYGRQEQARRDGDRE